MLSISSDSPNFHRALSASATSLHAFLTHARYSLRVARILVVDDDANLTALLRRWLQRDGHEVFAAHSGSDGLQQAIALCPDLVILDWMLPGLSGIDVARRLRTMHGPPFVMLSARDSTDDRVTGLDAGAEDYIVKPFDPEELLARVRAALRGNGAPEQSHALAFADLTLDTRTRDVRRGVRKLTLTPREFDLLKTLMQHANHVLMREQLLVSAWGHDYAGNDANLDAYVAALRTKLESDGESRLIHTARGVGFVLRAAALDAIDAFVVQSLRR
jgi:two-component system, OmpR family, response regulator MprA